MIQTQYWNNINTLLSYLCRTLHIFFSMLTCSMIIVNLVYDNIAFKNEGVARSLEKPLKYINTCGVVMNASGFALVYFMRAT